ncbi:RagB/SusD family nutrient uptake outer membrane protein [Mucilaginibacter sp.]|uniref:RagB/SusD family nutrient uptake outer membrane protein n=1 Tax=Mucilaginibacter sp. TaxID=1882438 RepID=UPI002ED5A40E
MNLTNKYISLLLILGLTGTACKKDFLDKKPLTEISADVFWKDQNLANAYVNTIYSQIGQGFTESWMSSVVDETYLTWSRGCEPITQAYITPSNLGRMNGAWYGNDYRNWGTVWANIKNCNVFFENIDKTTFTNTTLKNRLLGEVTFIRALEYFDLVSRWGGMPLITKSFNLDNVDDAAKMVRSTYKENVDFIVAECDKAAALLPVSYSGQDIGRATKIAALALKSRMLLYAASPLMNKSGVDPLVGYASPDAARWQKAADAAKAVIDQATANGYSLYNKYSDVKTNYTQLFLDKNNSEIIFDRQNFGSMHYLDQSNGPNGYGEWGGNTPIQEFVDDFEMVDGTKFDWNNPAEKKAPYANRDARLYATVLCDGDPWKGRPVEEHFNEVTENGTVVLRGGKDTKDGPSSWNTSKTGYNVRKFLNEAYVVDSWTFTGASAQNWIWFRLAEFYLNYAEAEYNLGNEGEAKLALNKIRQRAQMPLATESGTALWDKIAHERRIELAFEEHRYFDTRRWMIASTVLNKPATGIVITRKLDGTTEYLAHTGTPATLVEDRKFKEANYWLPIPQSEVERNAALKQNPGY